MSPVFEAQYVVVLAAKGIGSEEFIRWDLPLSRGWSYFHGARLLDGIAMTFPGGTREEKSWWEGVKNRIRKLRK